VRDAAARQLEDEPALARECGAGVLTFHPGFHVKSAIREQSLERSVRVVRSVVDAHAASRRAIDECFAR
jgi:endonuclease IV